MPSYSTRTLRLVGVCFILSGATGLIYEVLWARMLGLVFGATTLAVSTVLAAFMGGLALGSALAGRFGTGIKRPVLVYGVLEIGIAVYALMVPFLFGFIDNLYAVVWQQFQPGFFVFSLWRFVLSCLMLLIPTTLMGATLPVLSAAIVRAAKPTSTSVTRLYTRNLLGAICGCLAAGFLLLPSLGVRSTIYVAAVINIVIGIATIVADWKTVEAAPPEKGSSAGLRGTELATDGDAELPVGGLRFWLFCAFVSGFVTISTQVAWTRILTMIVGSSTYAFSLAVALFLVGLSGGAYLIAHKRLSGKLRETMFKVQLLTAVSLVFSLYIINKIPSLLIKLGSQLNISSWLGLLSLQVFSIALLVLLPAFLMGMVMPLVLVWAGANSANTVKWVGRSYAVNTVGAIAGAFGAGFVLIPRTSTRITILFAAALCIVVGGMAYRPKGKRTESDLGLGLRVSAVVVSILLLFAFSPRLDLGSLSIGAYDSLVRVLANTRGSITEATSSQTGREVHTLLMYEEGPTATVSVRKDWEVTSMAINGRTNASDKDDMPTQVMIGQMPLLVAPKIKSALVVGYATGVTAGSMLQSPIESLEVIELEPATIAGSRFFEHVNNHPLRDPRMRLVIDDARTYLRVTPNRYDVIVSEPSHPWVPGVANLFTQEFFELGRDRLNDDGVFCQWVQIYQLSTESLRSVLATYQKVFPYVNVFRVEGTWKGKDLILIGSKTPVTLDLVAGRISDARVAAELARINIKSEADVMQWYVCNESQLSPAVAGAIINTDDNMHIETTVPKEAFRPLLDTNAAWLEKLAQK